ncbi:MAG: lytic transglycosylase domain-containing protein [Elusimicrobiota bacterium]
MVRTISRLFLVWTFLATTSSTAQSQTLEGAKVPQGDGSRRPLLLAQLPLPAGSFDWTRLNRLFDASKAREPLKKDAPDGAVKRPARPAAPKAPERRLVRGRLKQTRHPLVVPTPKATEAYRRTFGYLMARPDKTDRFDEIILKYAYKFELDPRLLKAIMAAESEFNRFARSPVGARGLMQVMPRTAASMGVPGNRLTDPVQNVRAGASYLAHLFSRVWRRYKLKGVRFQDAPLWVVQRVLAAYHAGPRFLYKNRWFRSTRHYVRKVLLFYQSGVTDIRRLPDEKRQVTEMTIIPSSSGSFR